MKLNKKGLADKFVNMIMFGFVIIFFIFAFLLIKNLFLQDIIPPYENAALDVLAAHGNDSVTYTLITSQKTNMENWDLNIDLLFFIFWVATTIIMFVAAYLLPPVNTYNLLSIAFIGLFVVGFFVNFVEQIMVWFVEELIINIFSAAEVNLPIFTFYIQNYFVISIVSVIFILFINQLSRTPKGESVLAEASSFGSAQEDSFGGNEE